MIILKSISERSRLFIFLLCVSCLYLMLWLIRVPDRNLLFALLQQMVLTNNWAQDIVGPVRNIPYLSVLFETVVSISCLPPVITCATRPMTRAVYSTSVIDRLTRGERWLSNESLASGGYNWMKICDWCVLRWLFFVFVICLCLLESNRKYRTGEKGVD